MQVSARCIAVMKHLLSTAFEGTGRSGKPERLFFFPEGRTYSPPARRAGGGIPPSSGTRALCEPSTGCFSRGAANAAGYPCRHCLCGWQTGLRSCSPLRCKPLSPPGQPANRLRKPAAQIEGSLQEPDAPALSQLWTMLRRTVHFLLFAPKETKTPPAGSRKGSDILWQSITLKPKL